MPKDKEKWELVARSLAIKYFNGKEYCLYRSADTKKESDKQLKEYKMPDGMKYRRIKVKGYHLIYISNK